MPSCLESAEGKTAFRTLTVPNRLESATGTTGRGSPFSELAMPELRRKLQLQRGGAEETQRQTDKSKSEIAKEAEEMPAGAVPAEFCGYAVGVPRRISSHAAPAAHRPSDI